MELTESTFQKDSSAAPEEAAARESDVSASAGQPASQRHEPAGEGNLFLVALRLRFEDTGDWEEALGRLSVASSEKNENESNGRNSLGSLSSPPSESPTPRDSISPMSSPRRSWKARAGREKGSDSYELGDVYRWIRAGFSRRLGSRRGTKTFMTWGAVGSNVALRSGDPVDTATSIVEMPAPAASVAYRRDDDADNCVAFTSFPITKVTIEPKPGSNRCKKDRYHFEFQIVDVDNTSPRTLSFGFAWNPPGENTVDVSCASKLPYSFIVGGDLPRYHFGGDERGKVMNWRPRIDVEVDSVVGGFLEVVAKDTQCMSRIYRLVIFQDNVLRTEIMCYAEESWVEALETEPYGVVDICGHVRGVKLRSLEGISSRYT
eukprot:TRINITY_DN70305_c0_g1_i1.p1 TRINITY_DN70305_c0_g1~~TRINITY_DN70305_c0_g1_i1.p1  ORF type:complete len:376 (-),score=50.36 TRINITY_DN70305_c0_g1_i1:39-1166(-)